MKWEIKCNVNEIQKLVEIDLQRVRALIIRRLMIIGTKCVNIARDLPQPPVEMRSVPHQPNYIDDTGNLRHSIGFLVLENGNVVTEDFTSEQGRNYALKLKEKYPIGYALIMVAGMEYAIYVSVRGYDVLDSAVISAQKQFSDWCEKMKKK